MKGPVSPRGSPHRKARQGGNEMVEFALFSVLMIPMLIWTFVNGFNLVRMIQCQEIDRDIASQYIHGVDYSTYAAQQVAARLAQGFNLQIGGSFSGNEADNSSNGGNVYMILSQVMYIGAGSCGTQSPCNNQNKYVFIQQITFGESTIKFNGTQVCSQLGSMNATRTAGGYVLNILTDANAVCSNCSSFFQTQLTDGQVAYVVEAFFADPALAIGAYPSGGIYTRTFL